MSETMIERLARTLNEIMLDASGNAGGELDHVGAAVRLLHAMRDPTENMAFAGGEAVPGDEPVLHRRPLRTCGGR